MENDDNASTTGESENKTSSDEESIFEMLLPYSNEPTYSGMPTTYYYGSAEEESGSSSGSEVEEAVDTRIGNFEWCQCGHCRSMETSAESICCREIVEISSERYEGQQCITMTKEFCDLCLNEVVLKVTLVGYNNIQRNNRKGTFTNKNLRFAGYKLFTWWLHNRLGKGIRRSLPSCAVWTIREKFPALDNIYAGFEYKEDIMSTYCFYISKYAHFLEKNINMALTTLNYA